MQVLEMEANGIFDSVMKGRWDEVVEAYEKNPSFQEARITRSQDTALHVAVSNGQTNVVLKLVEMAGENSSVILQMKNDRGNTPLHLAARLGNVKLCHFLATKDRSLIRCRNSESETPLFLSALHGKKMAFLCLHFLYKEEYREIDYSLCRRSNGDTILHSAISGEYFSLAFQIILYYPNLVSSINEDGLSPLHILASHPKAFKSGCNLPPVSRLIYYCVLVDKLEEETHEPEACLDKLRVETDPKYPQNYETCMDLFQATRSCFQVLTRTKENSLGHQVRQFLFPAKIEDENSDSPDEEMAQETFRLSHGRNQQRKESREKHLLPPNYSTIYHFFKFMVNSLLIILGFGISKIKNIREKKQTHVWAVQIMTELIERASLYEYEDDDWNPRSSWPKRDGDPPEFLPDVDNKSQSTNAEYSDQNGRDEHRRGTEKNQKHTPMNAHPSANQELSPPHKNLVVLKFKETQRCWKKETPLLIAAKMGVTEIVDKILDTFPIAIQDMDSENKNAVLMAVENRQTDVYNLLLKRPMLRESVFQQLDNGGNSALHLAAKYGDNRPWLIPGDALQMQWEIKWYKFVKKSMQPQHFFVKRNGKGQTAKEIFTETHKDLVKKGSLWLTKTSESGSVVAALIATVAFATSATVPGGVNERNGEPTLKNEPAFSIFAIASIVALCFSVTALVFFLSILTSRYQESDFAMDLPRKLFIGLTSLFASIAFMLLSFCAGHFFVLNENLRYVAFPLYAATCLPMGFFALVQLPLYFDLGSAIFNKVPERSYKHKISLSRAIHS